MMTLYEHSCARGCTCRYHLSPSSGAYLIYTVLQNVESSTGPQSKQCAKNVQTVVYKLSLYDNLFEFRSFTSTILNLGQVERSLLLQAVLAWVVRGPVSYIGLLVKFWTFLEVSTRFRSFLFCLLLKVPKMLAVTTSLAPAGSRTGRSVGRFRNTGIEIECYELP